MGNWVILITGNQNQLINFNNIVSKLEKSSGKKLLKHIANSSAVFRFPDSHMDIVRCGIGLYGASPYPHKLLPHILPVVSVKAKVLLIKNILKGQSISYGCTYTADEDKKVALIDIGYGKGFSRKLSSAGYMIINGKKAGVLGRVTMDITIVDVSNIKNVNPGDEAIIIGSQDEENITAENLASMLDTIPYEIFCTMGKMMTRVYR